MPRLHPGHRVRGDHHPVVALTRPVHRRARAVREVTARHHHGGDATATQKSVEVRAVKGTPARLPHRPLLIGQRLKTTSEQVRGHQVRCTGRAQCAGQLGTGRPGPHDGRTRGDQRAPYQVDVLAVVEAYDVHDRSTRTPERGDQLSQRGQHLRGSRDRARPVDEVHLCVDHE